MAVPAQLHSQLTSGNLTTITMRADDVDKAMEHVRTAIDLIHLARDTPNWESIDARALFNMSAWATRAVAEVCHLRLNRAKVSLGMAGSAYSWASGEAGRIHHLWLDWEKTAVKGSLAWFITFLHTVAALEKVKSTYGKQLDVARDYFEYELTDDQQAWFANGLARTLLDDLERGVLPGPVIPDTLAAGDDDNGWTPQGLGVDPQTGYLLQTSYNDKGQAVLTVVDPATGEIINTVRLGAAGDAGIAPNHAGGVSVDPETGTVHVNSSKGGGPFGEDPLVYEYDRNDILGPGAQAPGSTIGVTGPPQEMPEGAYSTFHGGRLYVGTFDDDDNGVLNVYEKQYDAKSGRMEWVRVDGPYETPERAQGVAIRDGRIYFSTSHKRHNEDTGHQPGDYSNPGRIIAYDLANKGDGGGFGAPVETTTLPTMLEGIAPLDDGIHGTYESGSEGYSTPKGGSADSLWPSLFYSRSSYAGSELHSEYESMNKAGQHLKEAQDAFDVCETEIHGLGLPASSLGDVPQAHAYATGVVTFFDETARWLDAGKLASGVTARGVIESAIEYEHSDQLSALGSAFLQARLGAFVDKDWKQ
ncbi:hypothetical protein CFH99_24840 [Nocardioides aromaticivorans]|uniref:Uncharacterized protein n=1 Tax=Nocardioides aromaticivorans TaxID=200618 RepID=A0ABX7PT31_9ACTN|nr:hypothetical protein [Nocardioides aromaticivorans]QSR28852.1 hypothetical protein CFH99_24840 [Nocardioides aromaticivorans]